MRADEGREREYGTALDAFGWIVPSDGDICEEIGHRSRCLHFWSTYGRGERGGIVQYEMNEKQFGSVPIGVWKVGDFMSLTSKELSSIVFAIDRRDSTSHNKYQQVNFQPIDQAVRPIRPTRNSGQNDSKEERRGISEYIRQSYLDDRSMTRR